MKILLIAYEFPPSPSPQSLRWAYLTRELVAHGHDVHVLAPDLGPAAGESLSGTGGALTVHRSFAGPIRGAIAWNRRRRFASRELPTGHEPTAERPQRSSIAVRLVNSIYRLSEYVLFPDIRAEWRPFARRALRRLLSTHSFDVVVSSHEPATCLELGLDAIACQPRPWIADLGDPVLAPYTPQRWRRRALSLERRVCRTATRVTVTADSAGALLEARHGAMHTRVITQGFTERPASPMPDDARLELVYAGSFYAFRRAEALFEAVASTPGVRLSVATVALPGSLRAIAEAHPASFRLLGFLEHTAALALQSSAHVLVNIANRDASQVPGKLYEYLGAGRPVLHLTHGGEDPGASLITDLRRGWVVADDRAAIAALLQRTRHAQANGSWLEGIDLSPDAVRPFSWAAIGNRLDALLHEAAHGHAL